jgi:hypothetical protein
VQTLRSELKRLYLPAGTTADGSARVLALAFPRTAGGDHWTRLCAVANAMQTELKLPAPAVSIGDGAGFALWLSLEQAVPEALLAEFAALLRQSYFADLEPAPAPVELPPFTQAGSGKWSAFIHPDLGASFADEPWLEVAPPESGQVALLEHLESITPVQFRHALDLLRAKHRTAPAPARAPEGLLLADATLEDIVRHLHALQIEPTFRHLIR